MEKRFLALALLLWFPFESAALSHSRAYQWGFKAGNLLPNWSFENSLDSWMENPASGFSVDTHFKAAGTEIDSAKSGSFAARVAGTGAGATNSCLMSNSMPFAPATNYTLSFFYKTKGTLSGTVRAKINWYYAGVISTSDSSTALVATGGDWALKRLTFSASTGANSLRVVLAEFVGNAAGTYYFDDVVLEEGTLDSATVVANRRNISEAMVFSDALGRFHQSQTKVNQYSGQYQVSGTGFDDFARPESTFLPTAYAISKPALINPLLSGAQTFYGASGPFNAKGYPFSRVIYSDEPASRVLESSSPDSAWQMGKGHTVKQNYYFVQDSLVPANIESPSTNNSECKYRLDWSKNQDSTYTLTWTNRLGQVIRSASNISKSTSGADTWKWAATRYEYYPNGGIKKVYTPIDDSAQGSAFSEVSEFNTLGQTISTYSPDRNLRKFWYNRLGQVRYSQDEEQLEAGEYSYFEYDQLGRLLSEGVHILSSLPQDSVDKDTYNQGTKIEQVGYIYDDMASFQSRTGFTLQEIMHYWQTNVTNLSGHLFCKYNKNQDVINSQFKPKDKFVADFFSYDDRGNVKSSWKFIGAMRDTVKQLQDIWYSYDEQNRMVNYSNYTAADEYGLSNSESYTYDYQGRVTWILGISGKLLAGYVYSNWGSLNRVLLGGNSSADSATNIDYFYHSQGGPKIIQASGLGSKRIYQQFLGRDEKAYSASGNPALIQPKFDGNITQQTYKFTSDMNSIKPVRTVNYGYDQLDRMKTSKAYVNTNGTPLDGNEDIIPGSLTMDTSLALSTWMEYDLNGRILGQRSAGVSSADSAKYTYVSGSYKLDKVTGLLSAGSTRNMSATGTFAYDNNGALLRDKSKKLYISYAWDGLPVSFSLDSAAQKGVVRCCAFDAGILPLAYKLSYPTTTLFNFYDADGNRVSRVEVESQKSLSSSLKVRSTNYVYMGPGMIKEWGEEYYQSGRIKSSTGTVSLYGITAQIGRIKPDGKYEFFIKNHLGSTVRTVDDRGRYVNTDERVYDYLAYGQKKDLKVGSGGSDVTQKWTGKELEAATGLYAMGSRWYDPELALFMSPDRKGQYFNSYSYGPGNPVFGSDPTGDWWEIAAAVVILAYAAYNEHEQAKDRARQEEKEAKDRCKTDPGCNPNNIHVKPDPSSTQYGVCVGNGCVSPVYVNYNGVDSREAAARGNDLKRLQDNQAIAEAQTQAAVDRVYKAVQQKNIREQMANAWNSTYERGPNRFGVFNETGFTIDFVNGSYQAGPLVNGGAGNGLQFVDIPQNSNTIGTFHVHPSYYYDSYTGKQNHSGFGPSENDNDLVQHDSRMPIIPGVIIDDRTRLIIIHDQYGRMRVLPPQTYYDILGY